MSAAVLLEKLLAIGEALNRRDLPAIQSLLIEAEDELLRLEREFIQAQQLDQRLVA